MAKTMKSLLSIFLAVLMVCTLMVIPSSAASVSLSKTSVTLTKGYQTTLKVNGTSSSVKWSTGDKSIATVTSKGKVVGKGVGTTYIYAKVSNTTLKCKVKVVAAKITASTSSITFDQAGDSKIVTMTVKGSHSGLTVGSTNKKVATASWVKPVEWDGNKIRLKITAKGEGDAKIKVYLKKYPSTCYKYINISVGDPNVFEEDMDDNDNVAMTILANTQNINVALNSTASLQVYCTKHENLGYQFSDSRVASVTAGTKSGLYKTFTIKGLQAGTTTLRFYDKTNTKKYYDVKVTVGQAVGYYEFTTTKPDTIAVGDKTMSVKSGSTTYYLLVPSNYDPAYTNSIIAKKFNQYSYYTVYDQIPGRISGGDQYLTFTNKNATYVNPNFASNSYYNNNFGTNRYVLVPATYDEVAYNTAVAQYNNAFEFWKIYNVSPKISNTWNEYIETWMITDPSTGKTITRYMLVPYTEWDQAKIDAIKEADMNANNAYTYYKIYTKYPQIDPATELVVMYTKNGAYRYMVVPIKGADILKRNEAIKNDTGIYEPYIMYETKPVADSTKGEYILTAQYGTKTVYILCTYPQNSAEHSLYWGTISTAAPKGN